MGMGLGKVMSGPEAAISLPAPCGTGKFGFIVTAVGCHSIVKNRVRCSRWFCCITVAFCAKRTPHHLWGPKSWLVYKMFPVLFSFPFHLQSDNQEAEKLQINKYTNFLWYLMQFPSFQCNAKNIRLIVMNNLLPSSIKMHQRYDLKGSTYKRKVSKCNFFLANTLCTFLSHSYG